MTDTIKIVLTGGSNSGKTELIEEVAKHFDEKFVVAIVSEAATELLQEGVRVDRKFQQKIANRQFVNEEETLEDAQIITDYLEDRGKYKDIILLYDRSFMDQLAYCSEDEWQTYMSKVLDTTSFDESVEVLNDRYDIVIHLQTNAEFNHVSEGRLETQEEAIELEKRTLHANQYFNNLYYVARKEDIEDKLNEVIDIIDYELKARGMR